MILLWCYFITEGDAATSFCSVVLTFAEGNSPCFAHVLQSFCSSHYHLVRGSDDMEAMLSALSTISI